MFRFLREFRRRKIRQRSFPEDWRALLAERAPFVEMLTREDRRELERHMLVFLEEKTFEGCGGLEITDEIRLTIAAQACRLLLHRETDYFPGVSTVYVYPSAYQAPSKSIDAAGVVTEGSETRLGEAWTRGPVVLSWDDVERGVRDLRDGHNVAIHEFAHQLDSEDGPVDGAPALGWSAYRTWCRVLNREYRDLVEAAERHRRHVLDSYGATNGAEFFAVATEAFFEKPRQLKRRHPEMYDEFVRFFRQDPAADWQAHLRAERDA